jgi:N-sulfoglucosamine sulfohydrolase
MRQILAFMICLVTVLVTGECDAARRPNILLITADDLGMQLGCYGEKQIRTPHLDRLARDGTLFDRAYITCSLCSPSRSSILKGLYPHQTGQLGNDDLVHVKGKQEPERRPGRFPIRPGVPNLFSVLKDAGYHVGIVGKLHVDPEAEFPMEPSKLAWSYEVKKYAQAAADFLSRNAGGPFFLMVNYTDPHTPFQRQVDGLPPHPVLPGQVVPPAQFAGWEGPVAPSYAGEFADYYNCVMRLDIGVGLLMDALEKSGQADNTLIIFLSDNGPPFVQRGKGTCHEGGLQVPFIVRWQGHARAGVKRGELVSAVDIVPTVAEAVGIKWPGPVAGQSLIPLLQGKDVAWRRHVFGEYNTWRLVSEHCKPTRTIRDDRYRLLVHLSALLPNRSRAKAGDSAATEPLHAWAGGAAMLHKAFESFRKPPEIELYDLQADPHERTNLAGKPELADVQKRLMNALRVWCEQTGDRLLDGMTTSETELPQ